MESRRFVKLLCRIAFITQIIKCEKMNKRGDEKKWEAITEIK